MSTSSDTSCFGMESTVRLRDACPMISLRTFRKSRRQATYRQYLTQSGLPSQSAMVGPWGLCWTRTWNPEIDGVRYADGSENSDSICRIRYHPVDLLTPS